MIPFIFIIVAILFVVIALFVSRSLSPIPYFPSNKKDIKGIVQSIQIANYQVVYDLGAGDGIVIFSAASDAFNKNLNTHFIAVEINPILLIFMWFRRLFNPNRKNIRIVRADIFTASYKLQATGYRNVAFFTYISPWYLEKVFANCKSQIKHFKFVSYFYPAPKLKSSRTIKGVHSTYVYNV